MFKLECQEANRLREENWTDIRWIEKVLIKGDHTDPWQVLSRSLGETPEKPYIVRGGLQANNN